MRPEDLFLAIGTVEESRLARSEFCVSSDFKQEDKNMNMKSGTVIKNLLVAALIVSMLAVTAYAVAGFLIYDSPEEMVSAIFGNSTGFDHDAGSIRPDPYGGPEGIIVEPTFDRVAADEDVVAEDVVPHVNPVGQSVCFNGYTLTVDAFTYDSATRCGFVTYLLENPKGVSGYRLQSDGEIWYDGQPDPVQVNQYGYPYIIQEKTTPTCLAATYYFQWDARRGEKLALSLQSQEDRYTPEEFAALIEDEVEARKQAMTPQQAMDTIRQNLGDEVFAQIFAGMTEEEIAEQCYTEIVACEVANRMEAEGISEAIEIPLDQQSRLKGVTAGTGSIRISTVSLRVDMTDLTFLHTDSQGNHVIDTGNIDSVVIRFADGEEYTVFDGYILNYMFCVTDMPEENVATEIIVPPEEDPNGEGYSYVENSHGYCLLTVMFNRIIDVDEITAVVINGTELPVDK